MIGQLQDAGNTTTLSAYLSLLSQSGLVGGLQKYANDMARQRGSKPKYQVYNNALKDIYVSKDFEHALMDSKLWGRIYESAVGCFLINETFKRRLNLYYWREKDAEVDFVLQYKDKIVAIEVKSNEQKDTKGLHSFEEKFHPVHSIVVGQGGFPIEQFLGIDIMTLFR